MTAADHPVRQLPASPPLAPMFARAVLSGLHRRPRDIPTDVGGHRLAVAERSIDPDHLAAYQRLCGFRVSDRLPPTYLHLLSFPLAVARMTEGDFPFPLLGLVHIRNTVRQVRPVELDEAVAVQVWADPVRAHPAGHQIDLLSRVTVGTETVWTETSTYLRRGKTASKAAGNRREQPQPQPQPVLGTLARWPVPREIGRQYAAVSGDCNPIHLGALPARAFGFSSAIAHGMWLKARTLAQFEGRLPEAFTADAAFKTPVFLPSMVELAAMRLDVGWRLALRDADTGRPHLAGTISPT
ncbi:MAG: hypothetical protein QOD87_1507 [Pseudonocardiales bacterium]|nr:hypothetical protein [Pseudonocardiales bacterium]